MESTRTTVVSNLATVCAEIGQRVAVVSTSGIEAYGDGPQPLRMVVVGPPTGEDPARRLAVPLQPADVEEALEDTSVPGVSLLDLRRFVAHPTQVVIRVPEVLDALRKVVDVVILEVPSFLTVHHGQGLAPLADVVLVVGERGVTTAEELRNTSAVLKRLGAPVVGMALTTPDPVLVEEEDEDEEITWLGRKREDTGARSAGIALPADASPTIPTHRRRRSVVEHDPVGGLGARSDQLTESREVTTHPEA
jgi:Mrp family chromosome partitioning ATPase